MTLEKKTKKSIVQRLKILILGKNKPNFLTRISVWAGFFIWLYLISWQMLTLISILLMGTLKQADLIEKSFRKLGTKLYGNPDILQVLTIHTFLQIGAFMVILVGLILIWRRKRIGFLFYVICS